MSRYTYRVVQEQWSGSAWVPFVVLKQTYSGSQAQIISDRISQKRVDDPELGTTALAWPEVSLETPWQPLPTVEDHNSDIESMARSLNDLMKPDILWEKLSEADRAAGVSFASNVLQQSRKIVMARMGL